jgi:crotonobetainyl-CoA:carnitine CoA-transferase CaiB-like acyl-CoA transferase
VASEGGLFEGLRVLDVASFIAGPAAATILGDFGADVIKVEPPGSGDPWRSIARQPGMPQSEHNYCWTLTARGKRSLALDLKSADGQAVLHRLVAGADVFVTNFPLPVRARLGIAYEQLSPLNPRLVYASMTAYGERGEEAEKTGFDATAWWARSGLMETVRADRDALPARSVPGMGDHPTALAVYGAIVTALWRRERTGTGAYVHSSLLASGAWANGSFIPAALAGAEIPDRPPRSKARNALGNIYRCRDGRWINLSISPQQEERGWPRLCQCLGRAELADDPRFATRAARHANAALLVAALDDAFAHCESREVERRLDRAGFNSGVALRVADLPEDRQMRDADILVPMPGAGGAEMTVNSPFWIAEAPKRPPRAAPALGQHSAEILGECGYSSAEIERLAAAGTIG